MAGKLAWTGLAIIVVGMFVGISIISAPTTISRDVGGLLITVGLGVILAAGVARAAQRRGGGRSRR
jgi:hypothetical protein